MKGKEENPAGQQLLQLEPPRRYFWIGLVYAPIFLSISLVSTFSFLLDNNNNDNKNNLVDINKSPNYRLQLLSHVYIIICFSFASLQFWCYEWYKHNVEGDLGMPEFVHTNAGITELIVVGIRCYYLYYNNNHNNTNIKVEYEENDAEQINILLYVATVLSCGMMGGAFYTWLFAIQKPICFVPALLVLIATIITRPLQMFPKPPYFDSDIFLVVAFILGNKSAATIWKYNNNKSKRHSIKKKRA